MKSVVLEYNWLQDMRLKYNQLKSIFLMAAKKINFHGVMRTIFCDKWYLQAINLEKYLIPKGWVYVDSGKDRKVWRKGNVVLKIAYNESGVVANHSERYMYRHFKNDKVRYAPCRLVQDNILMMRAVKPLDDLDPVQFSMLPKWALEMNDGPQVGVTSDGRILAYDYAEEDPRFNGGGNRAPIAER